jgi:UDP-N-acetylglucosamine 2-epimerase (non-hydrolysing)
LCDVVRDDTSLCIVFPVHMNPHVQGAVQQRLASIDRIHLISPQPYLPFIDLMQRARLIVTDSGGIQEEAPSLGKPVLVTRVATERPEVLSTGLVRLVGTSRAAIRAEILRSLRDGPPTGPTSNPCGDGRAAERILDFLEHRLL